MFQPKPIVDTITEEEKYGNHVDHVFGRKITKAVEGLSNAVNSVFRVSCIQTLILFGLLKCTC